MDRLLKPEQVSNLLGVSLRTVYHWTQIEFIPHVKIGKCVRFKEKALELWFSQKNVKEDLPEYQI